MRNISALTRRVVPRLAAGARRYIPERPPNSETINALGALAERSASVIKDFTWPTLSNAKWVSLDKRRSVRGIKVRPSWGGRGNWLVLCQGVKQSTGLLIEIDGKLNGNIIVVGGGSHFTGRLHLQGSGGRIVLGSDIKWDCEIEARLSSDNNVLFWGMGATSNGVRIVIEGAGRSVTVGDDCMFARNTHVATSDLHGISDAQTGAWLNPPSDVRLGRHVWVGQDAVILKGVNIGSGAIIGARSLVNRDVPPATIAAGSPAKPIKSGVDWTRERTAEKKGSDSGDGSYVLAALSQFGVD